jgi:hypothetical protein
MPAFDINNYLKAKNGNRGTCGVCSKDVVWSRAKIISHKSANCTGITDKEKLFFQSQRNSSITVVSTASSVHDGDDSSVSQLEPNKRQKIQLPVDRFVDNLTVGERDNITKSFATFFFRTGIPFRVAESSAMKDLVKKMRPSYVNFIPSAAMIGNSLLNKEYDELFERGKSFLASASNYSLVTDGWSNMRNEHLVNFVILVPGHKPFFFKSVSTVGISQTSEEIAKAILEVINELGVAKCVSVVTDNAANMRGAWDIIEATFPHIFANGCGAHVMNLLIKDICELETYRDTLSEVQFLLKFVKEHQHVLAKFNDLRREFKIARTLVLTVPTRWYTHFNSCDNLLKAKYAMTLLCEETDILNAISSQDRKEMFKDIVENQDFWSRLKEITKVLAFPTSIIGKFENDNSDLFVVYDYFMRLSGHWAFIHTSMGFAYMLTPSCSKKPWAASDKLATKNELKDYIAVFFRENSDAIV